MIVANFFRRFAASKTFSYFLLVFAAFLYGLKSVVDKEIALATNNKLMATTLTSLFSALFVIAIVMTRKGQSLGFKKANIKQLASMFTVGAIASGLFVYLTFIGLKQSTATFAALNQGVAALSTVLLAVIFLKERLRKIFVVILPLMVVGTYLVSVGKLELSSIKFGDIILLTAAVLIGISNIIARKVMQTGIPSQQVTVMRFLFGALVTLGFTVSTSNFKPVGGMSWMLLSGLLGGVFAFLLYEGIQRLGASIASSLIMLSPVFAAVSAWVILGDSLNLVQLSGMMMVVTGGALVPYARVVNKLS